MAFTLCYLGLLRSSRRTETDKDIEIMVLRHQVLILERQLNARRRLSPCGSGASPPSPGCCRDGAGAPSSSRQRRSFAGTEGSRGANGGAGDPLVALVGRPCPMSSSSSSSGSPERTGAGAVSASRASFEASEIPRTKRRRPTLNAFSATEVLLPYIFTVGPPVATRGAKVTCPEPSLTLPSATNRPPWRGWPNTAELRGGRDPHA